MWDVTFRTAVAQAELEDRTPGVPSHQLPPRPNGEEVVRLRLHRPELLFSCVAQHT